MEDIHGVDVSWLHHTQKDHHGQKIATVTTTVPEETLAAVLDKPAPAPNGVNHSGSYHTLHRPHLGHRAASETDDASAQAAAKAARDPKLPPAGRRNSWMSSITSKLSSTSNATATGTNSDAPTLPKSPRSPQIEHPNPFGAAFSPGSKDARKPDTAVITPPGSPKAGHTFLQSALRRLSSSGGTSMGKATGTGGHVPRKTMNVDPYRERCSLPDLNQTKLRRVAFCVDVEIAGAAQYVHDAERPETPPLNGEPSLVKLERQLDAKKKKDQKLKKDEGEALKRPTVVKEEKEQDGDIKALGEQFKETAEGTVELRTPGGDEVKEPTKKREKKKRSEGERKERKERKHQDAIANGRIPAEVGREGSSGSAADSSASADPPPKSQDQPTTDPLRIYRRCCQLRETPTLKRISEQISSPSACHIATPGVVSCLDLTGYWMELSDVITLGDYLAVVPVKKLVLENCGLGDEAVRVLLAGLLAAKTPEQARYNKRLVKKRQTPGSESLERLGVIEKLSLKNNPKIGKEGWRHISLFLYMSRSLKAIDLSMNPFPRSSAGSGSIKPHESKALQIDMPSIFQEALTGRLGGSRLEELVMAECSLGTYCIGQIVDAVIKCGATRLGLASNDMSKEGLEHVIRYVQGGKCQGLDIGGNDLRDNLNILAEALDEKSTLWDLSLADCQLAPSSLEKMFPALLRLQNLRFLDLSHNRDLFATKPSALNIIRKYLPQFPILKRLHLLDVAMTSEHAIALAEILPECRGLCHLNILENHLLTPLASAKTEASQEEACALYASLMAAVRVSSTVICIDIDVPSQDSSEVVKALAKQVVAYSLRNLERFPISGNSDSAIAALADPHGGEKQLTVPDVLLYLVGHMDGTPENHDNDDPAPDDDYIVGGTGVVKALDICLNRAADGRKNSRDASPLESGSATPVKVLQGAEVSKGKAKEMSKNLLGSARKIRARLQPALIKEAKCGNEINYKRLGFLDSTLARMILRFEDEYPETRLAPPPRPPTDDAFSDHGSTVSSLEDSTILKTDTPDTQSTISNTLEPTSPDLEEDTTYPLIRPGSQSHRSSSPSLASRQAQEEGRMHRFGQRIRRDILRPQTMDYAHGTTGTEIEAEYLQDIRRKLELFGGDEIKETVERMGPEAVIEAIGSSPEELEEWERRDPGGFENVREIRGVLALNEGRQRGGKGMSDGKEGSL